MKNELPIVYLARHGETAWTLSGQHTGLTDLPLTKHDRQTARRLSERLRGLAFALVLTSPLQRSRQTCDLAGFGAVAESFPTSLSGAMVTMKAARPRRNSRGTPRLELVPRRLPWRRNASASQRPCRSGYQPSAHDSRQRTTFHERAFHAGIGVAVARSRTDGQQPIVHVEHGEPQCLGIRKRSLAAGHPILERHSARGD